MIHSRYCILEDDENGVEGFSLTVHRHLHSLERVQRVVLTAPIDHLVHLLSVHRLVIVQTNDSGVISELQEFYSFP